MGARANTTSAYPYRNQSGKRLETGVQSRAQVLESKLTRFATDKNVSKQKLKLYEHAHHSRGGYTKKRATL